MTKMYNFFIYILLKNMTKTMWY